MKKQQSIILAVVLTLTLLLTSGAFAGGGEKEVVPARMVLDASLSKVSAAFDTPKANLEVARSRAFSFGTDKFLLSSIVDKKSKQAYMVSTDAQGKVWIAEPKIEGELVDYMSQMKRDETVTVSIWAIYVRPEEELGQIPSKYPDVPFEGYYPALEADVSPDILDAIEADIREIKLKANEEAVQPVVDFLQSTGSKILYVSKYAPSVDAELSKEDVYKLARLPEVESITLPEEPEPCMDQAHVNINADDVHNTGYDGGLSDGPPEVYPFYQTVVAVVDLGVDFTHPALAHAYGGIFDESKEVYYENYHGTAVAGCIASNDETYTGIAPGTIIQDANYYVGLGATTKKTWSEVKRATDWALNTGADVINLSSAWPTNGEFYDIDICRYFDHIAFEHNRLAVCAAGNDRYINNGLCNELYYVGSPANAYNVLAVGGIDDKGDLDWTNDGIWWEWDETCPHPFGGCCPEPHPGYTVIGSSAGNPIDGREKPEVCAPAVEIITTKGGGGFTEGNPQTGEKPPSGTSFAAPQVSGIAALLIECSQQYAQDEYPLNLEDKPELTKAIIMASAIHNVEPNDDPSYPFQPIDDYEGVGTVDAYAAYKCLDPPDPDRDPVWMWWDYKFIDGYEDVFEIEFYAEAGETVRFVLNWLAHTDYDGGAYGLRTDFGLMIFDPYNVRRGISLSDKNPWEIDQFTAQYTGTHRALVFPMRYTEGGVWERIAAAWYRWRPEATKLELLPGTDSNPVDTTHNLTATVYDQFGYEMEGVAVTWDISGVGSFSGTPESPTDVDGEADAVITSSVPGTSTVKCELTGNSSVYDTATRDWTCTPTTLELLPETDSSPVGTTHNLMATVYDQSGYVMEGVDVTWSISGVGSFSGTPDGVTDVDGEADAVITSSVPGTSTVKCEVTGNPSVYDTATKDWTYIIIEDFEWGSDGASLDTSGGDVDWEVSTPGISKAEIDTAQRHGGTRSARIYKQGSSPVYARHWKSQPDRISFYLKKDPLMYADIINGDGAHRIVVRITLEFWGYPSRIQYCDDTGYHDTAYTISSGTWYFIDLRNIDWEAATYDIYVNGYLVKYRAAMHTSSENSGYIYFGSWGGCNNIWIDDITIVGGN